MKPNNVTIHNNPPATNPNSQQPTIASIKTADGRAYDSLKMLTQICLLTGIITTIAMIGFAIFCQDEGDIPSSRTLICALVCVPGVPSAIVMSSALILRLLYAHSHTPTAVLQIRKRCLVSIVACLIPIILSFFYLFMV